MSIEIKHLNGTVLHTVDADTLVGADLSLAYLRNTDLCNTDLRDTDLSGADLRDADLRGADLIGADLIGAYLAGAVINPSQTVDLLKALGVIVKEEV